MDRFSGYKSTKCISTDRYVTKMRFYFSKKGRNRWEIKGRMYSACILSKENWEELGYSGQGQQLIMALFRKGIMDMIYSTMERGDAWEHYFIMQSPLIAPAGAVITESPLEFGSGRWLGLENIKLYENKPLILMEDLLGQKIQNEQIVLPVEEESTVMHLG